MKTITKKAYCFISITDDPNRIPELYATRKDCIQAETSYHGHECDDPTKRGIICKATLSIQVPRNLPATRSLRDYIELYEGSPAVLQAGNEEFNDLVWTQSRDRRDKQLKRLPL